MFSVYVLQSLKNGRLYTGSTNNLERRLLEHNNKQSKYTKLSAPFELVYKENIIQNLKLIEENFF